MTRRLRRCSTLLLAVPLLGAVLASPAHAADPPGPVAAAAGWLSTQFVDDAHLPAPTGDHFDSKFGSSYFPNYGENADVLYALAAAKAGATKAGIALGYLDAHLGDYADPTGSFGGPFDGSIAKVALAHLVASTSATSLLTRLKADECPAPVAQSAAKKASCTAGAPANIFASASDSFVILAEARAGGSFAPSADAVSYFLSLQCTNGGFTTGTDACGSGDADLDATAYAIMALQALGGHATQIADAANWLAGQRNAAGYWVSQSIPNTNSTGLATAALAGVGRNVTASRAWLLDQQIGAGEPGAGALKYAGAFTPTTTSATSPNVLATAQGVLGLTDDGSLATVSAAGSASDVQFAAPVIRTTEGHISPGGSLAVRVAGYAAGEQAVVFLENQPSAIIARTTVDPSGTAIVHVIVPAKTPAGSDPIHVVGQSSNQTTVAFLVVTGSTGPPTRTVTASPIPGSSAPTGPPLATTGANSTGLLPIGILALLAGAGLLLVTQQRRRGRHAA